MRKHGSNIKRMHQHPSIYLAFSSQTAQPDPLGITLAALKHLAEGLFILYTQFLSHNEHSIMHNDATFFFAAEIINYIYSK